MNGVNGTSPAAGGDNGVIGVGMRMGRVAGTGAVAETGEGAGEGAGVGIIAGICTGRGPGLGFGLGFGLGLGLGLGLDRLSIAPSVLEVLPVLLDRLLPSVPRLLRGLLPRLSVQSASVSVLSALYVLPVVLPPVLICREGRCDDGASDSIDACREEG
jgi:hypothetical protein